MVITDEAVKQAVYDFVATAGAPVAFPANAKDLVGIALNTGSSDLKLYSLIMAGSDYYLAENGGDCRPVDYNDFEAMVRAIDGEYGVASPLQSSPRKSLFYPYAPVPGAALGGQDLAVVENSYAFQRVNGKYAYRATPFNMGLPQRRSSDGRLVTPDFFITPSNVSYSVVRYGETQPLWTLGSVQALDRTLEDGNYTVLVKANYAGESYRGAVTYRYALSVSGSYPPEPAADSAIDFSVEASHAAPGEMIVLRVRGADAAKATATAVTDVDFTPTFFLDGSGGQIALVPISVYSALGEHAVTITCGQYSETLRYTVQDKQFEVQQLTVEASTAEETINSQRANNEYEAVVAPLRFVADSTQHWDSRFILPTSDERVTSPFGIIRYVNGGSTPTRHNALDLAVPLGTPVKAAGNGRILYAGFLQLTGNTIIIEHGYGLKSWYYHMDSLNTATGDLVAQGQKIGEVGSTGFSTGAHMHFAMSVNNVFVNPYTLINTNLAA
jgi:murein DD-endopeptidase MepM/ murein hydrolase activator NlpD